MMIKKIGMSKIVIFLILHTHIFAIPSWYFKLKSDNPNTYIGYGSGVIENEAKQNALIDISSQINTKIESVTKIHKNLNSSEFSVSSSQNSKSNLNGYEVLKMTYEDGKYFMAIAYENIPSIDKFVQKIKKANFYNGEMNERQNKFLAKSLINKSIRNRIKRNIDFDLVRKDKRWYIKYKNIMQVLDKKYFNKFFSTTENENILIKTNKINNVLYEDDEFYFKVKTNKSGYISVLSVYENGTVSVLLKNIKFIKGKLQKLPDEDFESIPVAGLIDKNKETFDLYVAILSDKKLMLDNFAMADERLINSEKYKNFDEMIEFLDYKNFSAIKVVTKPKRNK